MKHIFSPNLIRTADIRGIIGKNFTLSDAYFFGRAFATLCIRERGKNICLARDGRISSPDIEMHLVRGLRDSGANVIKIGVGTSPMLYFANFEYDFDGAIMITASHNPKEYNGFKSIIGGDFLTGKRLELIDKIARTGNFERGFGEEASQDLKNNYITRLLMGFEKKLKKDIKVVWDTANGSAGDIIKLLTENMPGKHIIINQEIDGTFPNHHPDPTVKENLSQLIVKVKDEKANIGFSFDGDGDRLAAVDSQGNIIDAEKILLLLMNDILPKYDQPKMISDIKLTQLLSVEAERLNARNIISKTGYSFINKKMKEEEAVLAGEQSGHIFIKDKYYGFDDAIYAAIRLLNIMAKGVDIELKLASYPKLFNTPDIRIDCEDYRKENIINIVKQRLTSNNVKYDTLDGLKVPYGDKGWWLIRPSNTGPLICIRAEAISKDALNEILLNISSYLKGTGLNANFADADFY